MNASTLVSTARSKPSAIRAACILVPHHEIVRMCKILHRHGFVRLPGIISHRAAALREKINRFLADQGQVASHYRYDDIVMVRLAGNPSHGAWPFADGMRVRKLGDCQLYQGFASSLGAMVPGL